MADRRFFGAPVPQTLEQVLALTGASVAEGKAADFSAKFDAVGALDEVGEGSISFLANKRYRKQLADSRASAVLIEEEDLASCPDHIIPLISSDPYRAYAQVARAIHPLPAIVPGIAASASIDPAASLAEGCSIGPNVVIEAGVEIGVGTAIGANSVIGAGSVIGKNCRIGPNNSISFALIGDNVRTLAGALIGERGFGFSMGPFGHLPIPQVGRVIIEDDVEVGAGTAIDRGAGPDTVIGAGTKIDNLVQIGHNVKVGRACILCGTVAIAGSAVLEDFCVLGGGVAVNGHITLGMGTRVGASSSVLNSTEPGSTIVGTPAIDSRKYMKYQASLYRLAGVKR